MASKNTFSAVLKKVLPEKLGPVPTLHKVRALLEPHDKAVMGRYKALGGSLQTWDRKDRLIMCQAITSWEDDYELSHGKKPGTTVMVGRLYTNSGKARRLLEDSLGEGKESEYKVRKTFPLEDTWIKMPG